MACSKDDSFSGAIFKSRNQFPLQHRPRMLKDFLIDDSNSCSSTGFKSVPRKRSDSFSPSSSTIRTLIENDINAKNMLLRSRSKTASLSSTISAFQALITAVKNVHFTAIKSPPIIPSSLSRRLSSKRSTYGDNQEKTKENETKVTVTIKDIIRWRSFRDVIEEQSQPLDLSSSSPHHYTTTTTATTTTTVSTATTPCSRSSTGSSWCDSDFTSEYLPCWNGNSAEKYRVNDNEEVKVGEIHLPRVGEVLTEAATGDKVEERQQIYSPVSVIDNIEFEHEESISFFDESQLARTQQKLMRKIQRFENLARLEPINLEEWMSMYDNDSSGEVQDDYLVEEDTTETNTIHKEEEEEEKEVEEKAWLMLNHVKQTSSLGECKDHTVERLVLDFFRDELCRKRYEISRNGDEMLRRVKSWMDGEHSIWTGCDKEAYVKNMDKEEKWSMWEEEEQKELALAIENGMMGALLDELLIDLIS